MCAHPPDPEQVGSSREPHPLPSPLPATPLQGCGQSVETENPVFTGEGELLLFCFLLVSLVRLPDAREWTRPGWSQGALQLLSTQPIAPQRHGSASSEAVAAGRTQC